MRSLSVEVRQMHGMYTDGVQHQRKQSCLGSFDEYVMAAYGCCAFQKRELCVLCGLLLHEVSASEL